LPSCRERFPDTARTFALDVTKPEQIQSVAKEAIAAFGRIDVLVGV
jgi:NAD(P)-dependent dehydrogenase (short-subunit alcohol dehydrogenase family)